MRLNRVEQLANLLAKGFVPVYCFSGDEPLQLGEAADAVRQAAYQAGFNREVFEIDSRFRWQNLLQAAESQVLFSHCKLLDIRIPSAKPGQIGAKVLTQLVQLSGDTLIVLMTTGKMAPTSIKSQWYQMLKKHGVVLQVWPLQGTDLLRWIEQRMSTRGMKTDGEGLRVIGHRVAGNLLAAAQEIDKLYLLHGAQFITTQTLLEQVTDQARYDVFTLLDQILMGRIAQVDRILSGLRDEGVPESVVLWVLARETRVLIPLAMAQKKGLSLAGVYKQQGVWKQRQSILETALGRLNLKQLHRILLSCAWVDRVIKGQVEGNAWEELLDICLCMADVRIFDKTTELFRKGDVYRCEDYRSSTSTQDFLLN